VGIALAQACVLGWIETRIHARQDCKLASWWQCEIGFVTKGRCVIGVRRQNFV
jgi:hypothetical protein